MDCICRYFEEGKLFYHHSRDEHPLAADFPMHAHEYYEIYAFLSGNAGYRVEGTDYPLSPGSILLMRPAETHKLQLLANTPYERMAVHFSAELLRGTDPDGLLLQAFCSRPLGKWNLYTAAELGNGAALDCLRAMSGPSADSSIMRLRILCNLFPLLWQLRTAFARKQSKGLPAGGRFNALVEYINNHLTEEDLSLETLSGHFFLSKSQMNRQFRQATGSAVWEYVLIKRLMMARSQIREGVSATQTSANCGFRDYSSFYRAYKARFGVSPKNDFRRK